jgi:hypothetical protein
MPFRNRNLARRVAKNPCKWCGWQSARRHAAHLIDEAKEKEWNAISLCPNCHEIFEAIIRPMLHKALTEYGATGLPDSWRKDNKMSTILED